MKIISKRGSRTLFYEDQVYRADKGIFDVPDGIGANLIQSGNYSYFTPATKKPREPFNPKTWGDDYKKIILDIPIGYNNGYGKAGMMLAQGLIEHKGVDTYIVNSITHSKEHYSPELTNALTKTDYSIDSYYVKLFPGSALADPVAERFIGYSMLEATLIPQSWVDIINRDCERVLVPCLQNKQAFIDSGVNVDVHVLPLAVDFSMFPRVDRDRDDNGFVFGIMGNLTYRKGPDVAVRAFLSAFDDKKKYKDVHLYIKTLDTKGLTLAPYVSASELINEDRIIINSKSLSPSDLITEFFQKIDAFVFPSRGEGFGLPPVEAMATGLPVIGTNFSGLADILDPAYSYPIGYELVDMPTPADTLQSINRGNLVMKGYDDNLYREGQKWAEPDVDELVQTMRYLYENREDGIKKGKKASKEVRKLYNPARIADQLIEYLNIKF